MDLGPLRRKVKSLEKRSANLLEAVESGVGTKVASVMDRLAEVEEELQAARRSLAAASSTKRPKSQPLTPTDVARQLSDLSRLLETDLSASAAVLRQIVQEFVVYAAEGKSKRGYAWTATFRLHPFRRLNASTSESDPLSEASLEFSVRVAFQNVAERNADQILELHGTGLDRVQIAKQLRLSKGTVATVLDKALKAAS